MASDTSMLSPAAQTGSRIAPAKARIGIILSSGNRVVEAQLRAFAPPELGIHVTRMRMSKDRTQSMPEQIDTIIRAAELVADAKVDVIVLQASSFAMEKVPTPKPKSSRQSPKRPVSRHSPRPRQWFRPSKHWP